MLKSIKYLLTIGAFIAFGAYLHHSILEPDHKIDAFVTCRQPGVSTLFNDHIWGYDYSSGNGVPKYTFYSTDNTKTIVFAGSSGFCLISDDPKLIGQFESIRHQQQQEEKP